mgnify:CR=1 FL=1
MQKNKKNGIAQRRIEAQKVLDKKHGDEGDVWQDVDEHERDVFDKDGYFDVMDTEAQISASDMELLNKFAMGKKGGQQTAGNNLADMIMNKMAAGDFEDGDAVPQPAEI